MDITIGLFIFSIFVGLWGFDLNSKHNRELEKNRELARKVSCLESSLAQSKEYSSNLRRELEEYKSKSKDHKNEQLDEDDEPDEDDLERLRQRVDNLFERIVARQEEEESDESKISVRDEQFAEFNPDGSIRLLGHGNVIDYTKHDMDVEGQRKKTLQMLPSLAARLGLNKYPRLYQDVEDVLESTDYDEHRYSHGEFNPPDLIICSVLFEIIEEEMDSFR